ncbi:MAG: divergent polysaccharide deacetylase family protein [bacterium]
MNLNLKLTYAILPGERFSIQLADLLAEKGQEVILHMPLEPENYPEVNPGAYALLTNMSDKEIEYKVAELVKIIPNIKGANIHMGSAFSANEKSLAALIGALSKTSLYFLDSRTSLDSKVVRVAAVYDYPVLKSNLFLDTEKEFNKIVEKLELSKKIALRKGSCIAIGHIHSKELAKALASVEDDFRNANISFVTLSELLN